MFMAALSLPPWQCQRSSGSFYQITIAVRRGSGRFFK
jgi:hypothetical protein